MTVKTEKRPGGISVPVEVDGKAVTPHPDIEKNQRAARSHAGMKKTTNDTFAHSGDVLDDDGNIESSLFRIYPPR